MGRRNHLVEGVSGTGKTSVCRELQRRGYHAVNGDTELAYQGDPSTGLPTDRGGHDHHLWHVERVQALASDHAHEVTFFCGGSRNFSQFLHLFDVVFVLDVDPDTLQRRLEARPPDEWGGTPEQRAMVARLHRTGADIPRDGVVIDTTAALAEVVDELLRRVRPGGPPPASPA